MAYVKVGSSKSATACLTYGEFKEKKRREDVVIGSVNCRTESAKAEFKAVRFLWHQENGIQAHTVIQSFDDDITMEKANELGVETAKRLAKGHQAVVFTHNDGDGGKIHNHIVINAVNMENGSKINTSGFLYRARDISNEISREENLHVIKERKAKLRYTQAEQGIINRKDISWKDEIREVIEVAKNICDNVNDFVNFLCNHGVTINERNTKKEEGGKAWTYYHKNGNKVRASKLGDEYLRSKIMLLFDIKNGYNKEINTMPNLERATHFANLIAEREEQRLLKIQRLLEQEEERKRRKYWQEHQSDCHNSRGR